MSGEHVSEPRRDGSEPLEEPVRTAMEAGFGYDFSGVRLHSGEEAAETARSMRARAVTIGSDVYLARDVPPAPKLIAHELAHVVQQGGRAPAGTKPDPVGEQAAESAAETVLAGGRAQLGPMTVTGPQRSPDPPGGGGSGRPPALTPEEMWTQLVQSQRGFTSSTSGAGDSYRSSPATVPPGSLAVDADGNPTATGAPLGKGFETYAGVQLVDAEGRRVAVAADHFHGSGPDAHAEARCVRALETHGPAQLPGGKLIVVSDQTICTTCRERLITYARSRGLTVIEPHEPVRARVVGVGEVSPKTASRSSTRAGRPALSVVAREPIPIAPPNPPAPATSPTPKTPPSPPPNSAAPQGTSSSPPKGTPSAPKTTPSAPAAPKSSPPTPATPETAPATPKGTSTAGEPTTRTAKSLPADGEVVKSGRLSVKVEYEGGRAKARVTGVDANGLPREDTPALSRTPKGSVVARTFTAVQLGRTLLDLYANASDEQTRTTVEKVTHPLQSYMRSVVADAEAEFLAGHPDPARLEAFADVEALRGTYENEWRGLRVYQARAALLIVGLGLIPVDQRGPDWDTALARVAQGAAAPPQKVASFRSSAENYESRGIDLLQQIAPYRSGLPQLADEIDRRAEMLQTIAGDLDDLFWSLALRYPILEHAWLPLHSESAFVGDLAGRMSGFAQVVRARDRAYTALDDRLSAELHRLGRHIDNPGRAIAEQPPRPRP
ncbi:DUF4157 domain-containing protein [Actinoplanes sp. LDG1-06]|uniref:DUF4157 domain-containing protein n=1 Tax=Paractinoplanes ovalisporus TaxID=2810368 RepID=A0ABS2AFR8_9ACTN|nr:DUF4157 domain-containing protein [Actinoplanes ovalisporus]MBM2618620.1 DUF4157 domain-containing protein [Actinoplanes ovalisporus]